jgi:uncharacterized protein (TIGR02266 family)
MSEQKPILVICRSAVGQMYLGVLLKRIWYAPTLATTAEEGIRLAQKTPFSLVALDGDLATPDLKKTVTLLRNDPSVKDLPLVMFMTPESSETHETLLGHGCAAIFSKPLDLAIVYGVLARLSGELRQTPRIPVKFRVEIEEGTPDRELTCIDLSEGGMYLRTHKPLQEGSILHVKFTVPRDMEAMKLNAEVVRTAPLGTKIEAEPGMGLRFVDMPEQAKLRIRNFVQWELMRDLDWEPTI